MVALVKRSVDFAREHPYQVAWGYTLAVSTITLIATGALLLYRSVRWDSCACDYLYPYAPPTTGPCVGMDESQRKGFCKILDANSNTYFTACMISMVVFFVLLMTGPIAARCMKDFEKIKREMALRALLSADHLVPEAKVLAVEKYGDTNEVLSG